MVDLVVAALEHTSRVQVGCVIFAGTSLLRDCPSRQFNHGTATVEVVLARTGGNLAYNLSSVITLCNQILAVLIQILGRTGIIAENILRFFCRIFGT